MYLYIYIYCSHFLYSIDKLYLNVLHLKSGPSFSMLGSVEVSLAETKRKRVAIYGGTFDPPTNSHMSPGRLRGWLGFAELMIGKS